MKAVVRAGHWLLEALGAVGVLVAFLFFFGLAWALFEGGLPAVRAELLNLWKKERYLGLLFLCAVLWTAAVFIFNL